MFVFAVVIPSASGSPLLAGSSLARSNDCMQDYLPNQIQVLPSQIQVRSHWRKYVALIRFHYHCSFVGSLLGALVVTRDWPGLLLWRFFLLYVSMNVLLYGGLYSLNAITDAEADNCHPFKRRRPVASGEISRKAAGVFAAGLIVAGFVTGWA